jgi:hypothetical protein
LSDGRCYVAFTEFLKIMSNFLKKVVAWRQSFWVDFGLVNEHWVRFPGDCCSGERVDLVENFDRLRIFGSDG